MNHTLESYDYCVDLAANTVARKVLELVGEAGFILEVIDRTVEAPEETGFETRALKRGCRATQLCP